MSSEFWNKIKWSWTSKESWIQSWQEFKEICFILFPFWIILFLIGIFIILTYE